MMIGRPQSFSSSVKIYIESTHIFHHIRRVFKRMVPELSQRDTVKYWRDKAVGTDVRTRISDQIRFRYRMLFHSCLRIQRGWGTSPAGPPSLRGVKMWENREKWGVKIGNTQIGLQVMDIATRIHSDTLGSLFDVFWWPALSSGAHSSSVLGFFLVFLLSVAILGWVSG